MKSNKQLLFIFYFIINLINLITITSSILYPCESESREIKSLNGLWTFKISPVNDIGFQNSWYKMNLQETGDTIQMPVPASFNDITANSTIRDFLGWSWYQNSFYIPRYWHPDYNKRIFVHFGGVNHASKVWLNGNPVGENIGGYLPFQVELTDVIKAGIKNNLTLSINNALNENTLPQMTIKTFETDARSINYTLYTMNCDYYNYGGINRPVTLFTTPKIYICDIEITTGFDGTEGYVDYKIIICGGKEDTCNGKLFCAKNNLVAELNNCEGRLNIKNVQLWWPINSNETSVAYMYMFEATITANKSSDTYRQPVGIRTVTWNSTNLLLNNKPVYLHGTGMHEDSDIRGRGFDYTVSTRDLHLMKWLGMNSFRTSHYPYAEETLIQADLHGFLVIMEAPACNLDHFSDDLLHPHEEVLKKMIGHYKNRPSIIMWSLANEPTSLLTAIPYFRTLVDLAKSLDQTRPVTFATGEHPSRDHDSPVKLVDIICVNRYYGWYTSPGRLDLIQSQVLDEFRLWRNLFDRPVLITEYGAGSLTVQHSLPSSLWSEEYHVDFMLQHFKAFNILRAEGGFVGEMVWNFADFNVQQEYFRSGRCSKGLFSRDRQPKAASYIVRARYLNLIKETNIYDDDHCPTYIAQLGIREEESDPLQTISGSEHSVNINRNFLIMLCVLLRIGIFYNYL